MAKIEEMMQEYYNQCKLAKELYDFMLKYNGYDVVVRLKDYNCEDLCIGEVTYYTNNVWLKRDFFSTYPPLATDWDTCDSCVLIGLEYPEKDVVKILRKDGEIYIKGVFNENRAKTAKSVDIVPKNILGYGQKEFIDEIWSKKIDDKQYFIIDFFRAKKHDGDLVRTIFYTLGAYKNPNVTKTMYIRKHNNHGGYEVGLWDIVNECPIPD